MTFGHGTGLVARLCLAVAVLVCPAWLLAADKAVKPAAETVEMFAAIEAGQIDVKLIPKDSKECRVLIENKTKKPLTVKLPSAFAGVPVLAQGGLGGMGMGGAGGMGGRGNRGGMTGGGGMQGMGGGFGGMGGGGMGMGGMMGGMGGMGGGGGFFNVAPEKVGKMKITTVCLEHGKEEPRAAAQYEIKPIEEFTDKTEVHKLLGMLGNGMMPQRVAQVAAWHLSNDMSWQELAGKQLRFANGTRAPYFSPAEIQAGMQAVAAATKLAKQQESEAKYDSLSQK